MPSLRTPPDCTAEDAQAFLSVARWISEHANDVGLLTHSQLLADAGFDLEGSYDRPSLTAAVLTIADLALQGWRVSPMPGGVHVERPDSLSDHMNEKSRVRRQEHIRRDAQLDQPSVRAFVRRMESPRLHRGRLVSVFSLMRDGRDLRATLTQASLRGEPPIRPYVQFVNASATCAWTGLRLMDIWRYFRLTWANAHSSVPGRSMLLLVRDSAAPDHPVIGIAALASPIVQISDRDRWMGWDSDSMIERLAANPTRDAALWLQARISGALSEIYQDDLRVAGLLSPRALGAPTEADIKRLREDAATAKAAHQRSGSPAALRNLAQDWRAKAQTPLFRSKRSDTLAKILQWRLDLEAVTSEAEPEEWLRQVLGSKAGRRTLTQILRHARGERVGTVVADLSVCGALAPYNHLAAGKLIGALAVSPSVCREYQSRYSRPSEIASSMAGRSIVREARLAFVGTTSLYGSGSSQYNRLFWPTKVTGGPADERNGFHPMGRSRSFGTAQFHDTTVQALARCASLTRETTRVNHIFGEGVSPRLRKARQGLAALGWPADLLLQHGRERLLYGVPLVRNLTDYALGLEPEPAPLFDPSMTDDAQSISHWWWQRWGQPRSIQPAVLDRLMAEQSDRPVHHGARVNLPPPTTDGEQ